MESFPPPWSDQSHAGDRDEANTVSEEGSLYLAVGGDKAEATQATTSPQGLGQSGDPLPPNLCMMGDRSSPSVMVSLVNPLIREVSRELWLGAGWGWGWGTPTSMASNHCAAWGIACLRGDALGKMRGEIGGVRDHVELRPAQSPRLLSPGLALQSSPDPPTLQRPLP